MLLHTILTLRETKLIEMQIVFGSFSISQQVLLLS